MPAEGLQWLPRADLLSYEEIAEIVGQLSVDGLTRIRNTGGEPTIRPELEKLIGMLRNISAVKDISLSTNRVRLAKVAPAYRAAGLDR